MHFSAIQQTKFTMVKLNITPLCKSIRLLIFSTLIKQDLVNVPIPLPSLCMHHLWLKMIFDFVYSLFTPSTSCYQYKLKSTFHLFWIEKEAKRRKSTSRPCPFFFFLHCTQFFTVIEPKRLTCSGSPGLSFYSSFEALRNESRSGVEP